MMPPVAHRRVITGLNAGGRSTVLVDGPLVAVGDTLALAWKAGALPADNSGTGDAVADGAFSLDAMQQGGAHFLVYDHPPRSEGFWHATDTLDFIYVIEGSVVLELETGPVSLNAGDLVADRGVLHRWRNDGDAPCRTVIVNLPALPLGKGRTI